MLKLKSKNKFPLLIANVLLIQISIIAIVEIASIQRVNGIVTSANGNVVEQTIQQQSVDQELQKQSIRQGQSPNPSAEFWGKFTDGNNSNVLQRRRRKRFAFEMTTALILQLVFWNGMASPYIQAQLSLKVSVIGWFMKGGCINRMWHNKKFGCMPTAVEIVEREFIQQIYMRIFNAVSDGTAKLLRLLYKLIVGLQEPNNGAENKERDGLFYLLFRNRLLPLTSKQLSPVLLDQNEDKQAWTMQQDFAKSREALDCSEVKKLWMAKKKKYIPKEQLAVLLQCSCFPLIEDWAKDGSFLSFVENFDEGLDKGVSKCIKLMENNMPSASADMGFAPKDKEVFLSTHSSFNHREKSQPDLAHDQTTTSHQQQQQQQQSADEPVPEVEELIENDDRREQMQTTIGAELVETQMNGQQTGVDKSVVVDLPVLGKNLIWNELKCLDIKYVLAMLEKLKLNLLDKKSSYWRRKWSRFLHRWPKKGPKNEEQPINVDQSFSQQCPLQRFAPPCGHDCLVILEGGNDGHNKLELNRKELFGIGGKKLGENTNAASSFAYLPRIRTVFEKTFTLAKQTLEESNFHQKLMAVSQETSSFVGTADAIKQTYVLIQLRRAICLTYERAKRDHQHEQKKVAEKAQREADEEAQREAAEEAKHPNRNKTLMKIKKKLWPKRRRGSRRRTTPTKVGGNDNNKVHPEDENTPDEQIREQKMSEKLLKEFSKVCNRFYEQNRADRTELLQIDAYRVLDEQKVVDEQQIAKFESDHVGEAQQQIQPTKKKGGNFMKKMATSIGGKFLTKKKDQVGEDIVEEEGDGQQTSEVANNNFLQTVQKQGGGGDGKAIIKRKKREAGATVLTIGIGYAAALIFLQIYLRFHQKYDPVTWIWLCMKYPKSGCHVPEPIRREMEFLQQAKRIVIQEMSEAIIPEIRRLYELYYATFLLGKPEAGMVPSDYLAKYGLVLNDRHRLLLDCFLYDWEAARKGGEKLPAELVLHGSALFTPLVQAAKKRCLLVDEVWPLEKIPIGPNQPFVMLKRLQTHCSMLDSVFPSPEKP